MTYKLDDTLQASRQVQLDDTIITMSQYGKNICCADSQIYSLVALKEGRITSLFPYDSDVLFPVVHAIGKDEFILVTASTQGFGIGVFISASGDPIRGTLQWPAVPIDIMFHAPYVISLLKNCTIQIHNIETQTLVQSIPVATSVEVKFMVSAAFPMDVKGASDENSNNSDEQETNAKGLIQIIIGTSQDIFGLMMLPWDTQLDQLFESNQVEEALILLGQISENEESKSQIEQRARFHARAGFHFLALGKFKKSMYHFERGDLRIKYLLWLYRLCDINFDEDTSFYAKYVKDLNSIDEISKLILIIQLPKIQ